MRQGVMELPDAKNKAREIAKRYSLKGLTGHEAFLKMLLKDHRLGVRLVFSDWLEERGEMQAAFDMRTSYARKQLLLDRSRRSRRTDFAQACWEYGGHELADWLHKNDSFNKLVCFSSMRQYWSVVHHLIGPLMEIVPEHHTWPNSLQDCVRFGYEGDSILVNVETGHVVEVHCNWPLWRDFGWWFSTYHPLRIVRVQAFAGEIPPNTLRASRRENFNRPYGLFGPMDGYSDAMIQYGLNRAKKMKAYSNYW